jgi:electron transfer flavoprotein beta subunit
VKILSTLKPVADPASRLSVNDSKTWIRTQDLTTVASEADAYALEAALQLREKHGGEVVVVAYGGEDAAKVLRTGLATGADRAIHVLGQSIPGAGEFQTAEILAKAVEKEGNADLVLTGVQSDDLGTGATGVMLAELLGWAHATVVVGADADPAAAKIEARRELEGGTIETVELPLPAVLTIQYGANQPRYASLKGIMAAKKKPFAVWSEQDLGVSAADAFFDIKEIALPEKKSQAQILSGTPEETVTQLVEKLRKEAKVL